MACVTRGREAREEREGSYHENDAQFLDECPAQCMLIMFVWGIRGSRLPVLCAGDRALLLDKDISDKVIDDGGANGRKVTRPEHDPRGGEDLKCVQHFSGGTLRVTSHLLRLRSKVMSLAISLAAVSEASRVVRSVLTEDGAHLRTPDKIAGTDWRKRPLSAPSED